MLVLLSERTEVARGEWGKASGFFGAGTVICEMPRLSVRHIESKGRLAPLQQFKRSAIKTAPSARGGFI